MNDRGFIFKTYTVQCGCGECSYLDAKTAPARDAKRLGWAFTRDRGWVCPTCQQAAAKP